MDNETRTKNPGFIHKLQILWKVWGAMNEEGSRVFFVATSKTMIENYQNVCAKCAVDLFKMHIEHFAQNTGTIQLDCNEHGEESQS